MVHAPWNCARRDRGGDSYQSEQNSRQAGGGVWVWEGGGEWRERRPMSEAVAQCWTGVVVWGRWWAGGGGAVGGGEGRSERRQMKMNEAVAGCWTGGVVWGRGGGGGGGGSGERSEKKKTDG